MRLLQFHITDKRIATTSWLSLNSRAKTLIIVFLQLFDIFIFSNNVGGFAVTTSLQGSKTCWSCVLIMTERHNSYLLFKPRLPQEVTS